MLARLDDDGRLRLDNNGSERELRRIAVGARPGCSSAATITPRSPAISSPSSPPPAFTRPAPEAYLRDLFRVLPHWPRDRYLELCPRDWPATRARLDATQLQAELGPLSIPDLAPTPSSEQPASR